MLISFVLFSFIPDHNAHICSPIDADIERARVMHEEGSQITREDDMNVEPPPSHINPKASPASTQVICGQWSQTEEGPSFQASMKHTRVNQGCCLSHVMAASLLLPPLS